MGLHAMVISPVTHGRAHLDRRWLRDKVQDWLFRDSRIHVTPERQMNVPGVMGSWNFARRRRFRPLAAQNETAAHESGRFGKSWKLILECR
jgi:hypothetical protein